MNKPQIYTISGKAEAGKNTLADLIKLELEKQGCRVAIIAYGDYVKLISKTLYGWNGEKDEVGREILQRVGTDVVRKINENFWVEIVTQTINVFKDEFDYFLIPDARFTNEIEYLKSKDCEVFSYYIERPNHKSKLTQEQLNHPSENGIDKSQCDVVVVNNGLEELHKLVKKYLV